MDGFSSHEGQSEKNVINVSRNGRKFGDRRA